MHERATHGNRNQAVVRLGLDGTSDSRPASHHLSKVFKIIKFFDSACVRSASRWQKLLETVHSVNASKNSSVYISSSFALVSAYTYRQKAQLGKAATYAI